MSGLQMSGEAEAQPPGPHRSSSVREGSRPGEERTLGGAGQSCPSSYTALESVGLPLSGTFQMPLRVAEAVITWE